MSMNHLTKEQEAELREVLAEIERRKVERKVDFFIPTEKQEVFFRSKSRQRFVMGANRCGKSEMGSIEAISYALGYRPYLKPTDPDYRTPFEVPVMGLITTESFGVSGTASLVIGDKMKSWIPKGELKGAPKKNQQGVPVLFKFKNGSELHILSYEQETSKFEGSRFHFWWGDENPPKDKFFAIQRGLTDFHGYWWITATPLAEPWTYDGLFLNDDVDKFLLGLESNTKHKRIWYGREVETGGLTAEAVQDLIKKYRSMHMAEGELQSRLTGTYKHLEGLVLGNFDPMVHLVKPFDIKKHRHTMYVAIDPHPKKPWCVMFLAVLPDGKMYVTKILYLKGVVEQIVEAILIELGQDDFGQQVKPRKCIIDPYAVMNDPQTGKSLLTDVREKSGKVLIPVVASKDKIRGIQAIRTAMHYDYKDGIAPTLFIFDSEKEGIRQLMGWVIDDSGKASKEDDDAGENLYRLMLLRPRYREAGTGGGGLSLDWSTKGQVGY